MEFARILAYVTGTVDQELLARNEYLAENPSLCFDTATIGARTQVHYRCLWPAHRAALISSANSSEPSTVPADRHGCAGRPTADCQHSSAGSARTGPRRVVVGRSLDLALRAMLST